jgi:hypothetical protein
MTTHLLRLCAEVCPATHHAPYPSSPTHCPPWCRQNHELRLWLNCCDVVVHSAPLETSQDQILSVRLVAAERIDAGLEPPRLLIDPPDALLCTIEAADEYAATIHRAAILARHLTGVLTA